MPFVSLAQIQSVSILNLIAYHGLKGSVADRKTINASIMPKPKCFVIMPISTPPEVAKLYDNDPDHFRHVFEHLLKPAVETAGYDAIPPEADGSEIIHASIIRNLETADMVLADMSSLNPNVFFEFGVRTSLNLPISVICDENVQRLPFDTGIINALRYSGLMRAWSVQSDIESISKHIISTATASKSKNMMWKYFGLSTTASAPKSDASVEGKLDLVLAKIQAIESRNREIENSAIINSPLGSLIPSSSSITGARPWSDLQGNAFLGSLGLSATPPLSHEGIITLKDKKSVVAAFLDTQNEKEKV